MRLRNVPGAREKITESSCVIPENENTKGKWLDIFQNTHPLRIEIGMGKGTFILEMAEKYPDINWVGIEKYSSVLVRGIEKLETENATHPDSPINNLYFMRMDAENIENYFSSQEVDGIYLNFSDPWPKERHAKRRLTSDRFLKRYQNILKDQGTVTFKTDNQDLFDFSVRSAKEEGWHILKLTRDLHHSPYKEGNVMTEYERKFSSMGKNISMMEIQKTESIC